LGIDRRGLEKDCEAASKGFRSVFHPNDRQGYQVFTAVFRNILNRVDSFLWFPAFSETSALEGLVAVVNRNSDRLGGLEAQFKAWPLVPCPVVRISWSSEVPRDCVWAFDSYPSAVSDTQKWVEGTLCRLKLCPYTAGLSRAAVGLEAVNIPKGSIAIRQCTKVNVSAASVLAGMFWEGVSELATLSQQQVATLLLIAPAVYDKNFEEFVSTCDDLIEPSVQATKADQIVGRAWFHPLYDTKVVGHSSILPGHALPSNMVEGFVQEQVIADKKPNTEDIARANNAVRRTPHATINLLRRSQLKAAKQVEAVSSGSKPNSIYVRNVLRILADGSLLR
jgi:hypothetical protein